MVAFSTMRLKNKLYKGSDHTIKTPCKKLMINKAESQTFLNIWITTCGRYLHLYIFINPLSFSDICLTFIFYFSFFFWPYLFKLSFKIQWVSHPFPPQTSWLVRARKAQVEFTTLTLAACHVGDLVLWFWYRACSIADVADWDTKMVTRPIVHIEVCLQLLGSTAACVKKAV